MRDEPGEIECIQFRSRSGDNVDVVRRAKGRFTAGSNASLQSREKAQSKVRSEMSISRGFRSRSESKKIIPKKERVAVRTVPLGWKLR